MTYWKMSESCLLCFPELLRKLYSTRCHPYCSYRDFVSSKMKSSLEQNRMLDEDEESVVVSSSTNRERMPWFSQKHLAVLYTILSLSLEYIYWSRPLYFKCFTAWARKSPALWLHTLFPCTSFTASPIVESKAMPV